MSEKIRESFESWFKSSYGFCLSKDDETTYSTPWVNDMYHAWKASRAALVVELPANCKGMALTVDELRVMLDQIGVTLR